MRTRFFLPVFFILLFAIPTQANVFSVLVGPPNFELKGRPGDVIREIISITNADKQNAHYRIRTADWELNDAAGVRIVREDEDLPAGSCRSWTRIERKSIKLPPNGEKRYRFEVRIPADAPSGECRFAVLIEPDPETLDPLDLGQIKIPVAGRVAVIVYLIVGDAKPQLRLDSLAKKETNGVLNGILRLKNYGNAHARPAGSVVATDAVGRETELLVIPFPILPGRSTDILLKADKELSGFEDLSELQFPLQLDGEIEWDGGSMTIRGTLD